jgi:hypothetical protein
MDPSSGKKLGQLSRQGGDACAEVELPGNQLLPVAADPVVVTNGCL